MTMNGSVFLMFVLAPLLDAGALYISQRSATKVAGNEYFIVACRDTEAGQQVIWKNEKGVILGSKTRPLIKITSYGSAIMFESPLRVEDSGKYTCSAGARSEVFTMLVEPPLKFTDTATNQTGVEGSDFNIKCEVKGGTVSWYVDEGGPPVTDNEKFTVLGDGLLVKNITRADSKTYICKGVQQSTGNVQDRRIHFHVLHKPVHPIHPTKHVRQEVIYGYVNGTVNLTCIAIANPPATFQWRKNSEKKQITSNVISESPDVSILQLSIQNDSFFSNYICLAKNKYGSYEQRFQLKAAAKPQAPAEVHLEEVQAYSLVFRIAAPPKATEMDLETKGFNLKYRKIDDEDWKQKEFNITKDGLYSLDGLEPNTIYEVQAATRNAAGLSDFVASAEYRTSAAGTLQSNLVSSLLTVVICKEFVTNFW